MGSGSVALLLPLFLAHGLQKLDPDILFSRSHQPQRTSRFLIGFIGNAVFAMITQVCMGLIIIQYKENFPSISLLLGNIALWLAAGFYYSFIWILPSILA